MQQQVYEINHKLNSIELLRFIGVIFICIFHALFVLDPRFEIYKYARNGFVFVECFFIIAGFFLPNILCKTINFKEFAINKIIRLFPVVFFVEIIINVFHFHHKLFEILPNFFLLSSIGINQREPLVGYAWFLYVLFWIFCLYFCLLNFIKDKQKLNFLICILVYISLVILTANVPLSAAHRNNLFHFFNSGTLRGVICVGIGILIRLNFYNPNIVKTRITKITFTMIELFLFFYLMINLSCIKMEHSINYFVSYIIIFSCLLICFVNSLGYFSHLLNKINFYKIGRYSLSIYIMSTIPQVFLNLQGYAYICTFLISSIILGIAAYDFIEVPCKNCYKNLETLMKKENAYENS